MRLNAGLISSDEALERRERVTRESDFYGAMDGFQIVRGDAVAGILICSSTSSVDSRLARYSTTSTHRRQQNYVLLTIGDGLVAQIPSMLLSRDRHHRDPHFRRAGYECRGV